MLTDTSRCATIAATRNIAMEKSHPLPTTATLCILTTLLGACEIYPYQHIAQEAEAKCLKHDDAEYKQFGVGMSREAFCHAKGAWVRAAYVRNHDPAELEREENELDRRAAAGGAREFHQRSPIGRDYSDGASNHTPSP